MLPQLLKKERKEGKKKKIPFQNLYTKGNVFFVKLTE